MEPVFGQTTSEEEKHLCENGCRKSTETAETDMAKCVQSFRKHKHEKTDDS